MIFHNPTFIGILWLLSIPIFCRVYHKTDPVVEDDFISHFGNDTTDLKWSQVRLFNTEASEPRLKNFCAQAHKMAGKGSSVIVNSVLTRPRVLVFRNGNYKQRRVDVLSYGILGISHPKYDKDYWYMVEGDHGYITEGKQPDCVYYLSLLNSYSMKFGLIRHVCGMDPLGTNLTF